MENAKVYPAADIDSDDPVADAVAVKWREYSELRTEFNGTFKS